MSDSRENQPPPRSPLRDDEPAAPMEPIEGAKDPGPQVQRVTRDDTPGTDDPPPTSGDRPEQGDAERAAQEENAETSMDQPSQ
ncbi:hypothetical protein [Nocardioides pantholopis]|uniref:hypothetical protein n=1 Tax=Nocardioides pantholopis TaxID=2483798 RepID=UPI000FDC0FF7|nr:hypothetical protein [Nocardioides pantholopis]